MTTDLTPPIHPGEILREDFLEPFDIPRTVTPHSSVFRRAESTRSFSASRSITADTALRLAKVFGNSAQFWLNLQDRYELDIATDKLGDTLARITPLGIAAVPPATIRTSE
ncbi:HigA family addiction module antidote protein [Rhodococcus sp. 14C212]|uniref:HigA family addiction module antitoxin n=1 Tax=Rhodococcus sp. 14C212 TaxID=2711209 RepID=UPI0013ECDB1E|nr:HigA family addiction module antitoxin [Rhodococcus sp. 14C212]NGP09551.1 HigA family addiction module antidote protein [Rhodococcus sp. 14C212]